MTTFEMLAVTSFASGLVILVIVLGLVITMYVRSRRLSGMPRHSTEQDLTHMMILLQTMRDLLDDQRELARELNKSVDRKVSIIKSVVSEALTQHQELQETQKKLQKGLAEAKEELESLQRQSSYLPRTGADTEIDETPVTHESPRFDPPEGAVAEPPTETDPESAEPDTDETPRQEDPAESITESDSDEAEDDEGGANDLIDNWVGLDFGPVQTDEEPEKEVAEPVTEEETEEARAAFRDLLDIAEHEQSPAMAVGDNSSRHEATVRNRVYEYNDAGMDVSDIAREMGMGKGEVRLILNLREQKEA